MGLGWNWTPSDSLYIPGFVLSSLPFSASYHTIYILINTFVLLYSTICAPCIGAPPDKLFRFLSQSEMGEGDGMEGLGSASFGTDHKWVQGANNNSIDSQWTDAPSRNDVEKGHLRAAEQRAVSFQVSTDKDKSNDTDKDKGEGKGKESVAGRVSQSDSCVYNYTAFPLKGDGDDTAQSTDTSTDTSGGLDDLNDSNDPKIGVDAAQDELKVLEGELASVQVSLSLGVSLGLG